MCTCNCTFVHIKESGIIRKYGLWYVLVCSFVAVIKDFDQNQHGEGRASTATEHSLSSRKVKARSYSRQEDGGKN